MTESEPSSLTELAPPWLANLERRREIGRARALEVLTNQCPSCVPDSRAAERCQHRASADIIEGRGCRWRTEIEALDRTNARVERLRSGGWQDRALMRLVAESEAPPRPARETSQHFREMWAAIEQFMKDGDYRILLLSGSTGTGKTLAATWLASRDGIGAPRLVRREHITPSEIWDDVRGKALESGLLVIDDLGMEHQRDDFAPGWHQNELEALISGRYEDERRTVITTNLPLRPLRDGMRARDSIEGRYGDRVVSRILGSNCLPVGCGTADLRRVCP